MTKSIKDLADEINARFRSGNSVPVERAYITADEWKEVQAAIGGEREPVGELRVYEDGDSDFGHAYDICTTGDKHRLLKDMDGAKLYTSPPLQVKDGYVLVPKEKLQLWFDMLKKHYIDQTIMVCGQIQAMLSAAPSNEALVNEADDNG